MSVAAIGSSAQSFFDVINLAFGSSPKKPLPPVVEYLQCQPLEGSPVTYKCVMASKEALAKNELKPLTVKIGCPKAADQKALVAALSEETTYVGSRGWYLA